MKQNIMDVIKTRRSIRKYKETPLRDDEVKQILTCGLLAPRAMNQKSLLFVVLKDKKIRDLIIDASKKNFPHLNSYFYHAPTIIIVFGNQNCACPIENGSVALENMFLGAKALGIGSCWINYLRALFKTKEGLAIQELMQIPSSYFVVGTAVFGYPDEEKPERAANMDLVKYL